MATTLKTNMPWAVFRCPPLSLGEVPEDLTFVSGHLSAGEAMEEADRIKILDRAHGYVVAASDIQLEEMK